MEGTLPTDCGFTGQRKDSYLDTYSMGAREYDPSLGRWLSADTIVPGNASGASGGWGTIGYSDQTRLTPLTVGFHETQFLGVLNAENQELLQFGQPALWDGQIRQEHNVPMGPGNPQALNRYAYVLNNPLRYVDPTGHYNAEDDLTPEEAQRLIALLGLLGEIDFWVSLADMVATGTIELGVVELGGMSAAELAVAAGVSVATAEFILFAGSLGLLTAGTCGLLTANDFNNIQASLLALGADEYGAHIKLDTTWLGWDRLTISTDEGQTLVFLASYTSGTYSSGSGAAHFMNLWLNPSATSIRGGYDLCVLDATYWRWGYGDWILGLD